jgi:beta-lactamase class A
LSQYEKIITTPPNVQIDGKKIEVSELVISELVTVEDSTIVLNTNTVDGLLSEWNKSLGKPAGTSTINYLDGVVTGRTLGSTGLALNKERVISEFQNWFSNPEDNLIDLSLQQIQPDIIENREYSAINGPIQKAIDDWLSRNTGAYAVSFREIGGNNRIAGYKSSTSYVMASTYKMFVSAVAYQMIESGELSATKIIYNGKNVYDCISGAIKYSENECIIELGWNIGWEIINQKIAGLGISGVNINNYNLDRSYNGDKTANADSMAKLLQHLQTGTLLNSTHSSQLLSYMKTQIYRDGIPAGSEGMIANKVGFLDAYKHDMAIVNNGSTTYVLVILSNNSSWQKIADLSKTIASAL